MQFLTLFKNILARTHHSIINVRADNEYSRNSKICQLLQSQGIELQSTAGYSSYQNGTAENSNFQIQFVVKRLMGNTGLSAEYWPFAFHHAIMIHNITPNQSDNKTPYELMFNYPRHLHRLIPFGCRIYVYNEHAQGPLNNPIKATFIGYDKTITIAWYVEDDTGRIKKTSSFKANIHKFPFLQNNKDDDFDVPEQKANFNIDINSNSMENSEDNDIGHSVPTGHSQSSHNSNCQHPSSSSVSNSSISTDPEPLPTPKTPDPPSPSSPPPAPTSTTSGISIPTSTVIARNTTPQVVVTTSHNRPHRHSSVHNHPYPYRSSLRKLYRASQIHYHVDNVYYQSPVNQITEGDHSSHTTSSTDNHSTITRSDNHSQQITDNHALQTTNDDHSVQTQTDHHPITTHNLDRSINTSNENNSQHQTQETHQTLNLPIQNNISLQPRIQIDSSQKSIPTLEEPPNSLFTSPIGVSSSLTSSP